MSKPKVFVGRVLPEGGLEMIRGACDADVWPDELPPSREALLERVRGVDGLVSLLTDPVDAEVMDAAGPGLKVISNYAVGYDNVDVPAATARGIPVGNTPGVLTETTADLAFALLMAGARRIVEGADYVRAGKWRTWGPMLFLGHDVHGATLGIVGMGRIGQAMTRRAAGFGMRVVYYDPYCNPEKAPFLNITVRCDLDELLAESDFVSLHVPLTDQTRHLIDAGYTSPDRLGAFGGSAGGLLMGAVANLAPDDLNIHRQLGAVIALNLVHNAQEEKTIP